MGVANDSIFVYEVFGWPIAIVVSFPDSKVVVLDNWIGDIKVFKSLLNITSVFFKFKLWGVNTYNNQPIIRVFFMPRSYNSFMVGKSNTGTKHEDSPIEMDPIQAAIDYGIDVSMLVDNLQRSVTERIKRHRNALNTANKLRKAKWL